MLCGFMPAVAISSAIVCASCCAFCCACHCAAMLEADDPYCGGGELNDYYKAKIRPQKVAVGSLKVPLKCL